MLYRQENAWDRLLHRYGQTYDVPVWVLKATIAKESGFRSTAFRPEPAVGDGSRGLMQLLYRTALGLGYSGQKGNDQEDRTTGLYDPETSIQLGTKYLAQLRRQYPSEPWDAIYAGYNSGKIRRNAAGQFTNAAGSTNVNNHVGGWQRLADYFEPNWKMRPLDRYSPLPRSPVETGEE